MARNEIKGMREVERLFRDLKKVPQSAATRAARTGGMLVLRRAKAYAPVDTGELREGIILKRERSRYRGKAVYDVMMDQAKNDIFVKISKSGKRAYYPASQEYGFMTVDGKYIPGYRFLRRAVDDHRAEIEAKMLEATRKEVDKALRRR